MRWRPTVIAAAALGGRALLTAAMAAVQGVNILDGAATAKAIRAELGRDVDALRAARGVTPGLGVVLVGERRDSQTYVRMKQKVAAEIGVHCVDALLPDTASEAEILAAVEAMNADPDVHGILVQLPLPAHVDEGRVLGAIDFRKDADGFSETNAGCVELLRRHGVALAGKRAVVLGRSNIVGMPVAALLQACDATVTVCHSATPDVAAIVRDADVVVAAVGRARYVEASWLKPGCVVVDVGINAVDDPEAKRGYRLVGDVDFEAAKDVASLITPVPGGVGPMTIAMLMSNVVNLTKASLGVETAPLPGRLGDAETTTRLSGLPKEGP
ncbi:methenyltetrahydrofolate cyclohydrolase [Aureococcus anophagefferens]|uniref:Methenyltetrahydrofolate cyclohydrolase n=1 Tax=Aureococcus anophagefferens TaxID=44056 RepID=A0ABR1FM93_AURAN